MWFIYPKIAVINLEGLNSPASISSAFCVGVKSPLLPRNSLILNSFDFPSWGVFIILNIISQISVNLSRSEAEIQFNENKRVVAVVSVSCYKMPPL